MSIVPVPYTWIDGEEPDFRAMETRLSSMMDWLYNPPIVRLKRTTDQAVATSTHTAISWNLVEYETENMWTATLPTRVTPSTPGWYVGHAGFSFATSTTGYREMNVRVNGDNNTNVIRHKSDATTGTFTVKGLPFLASFNGTTDYIEVTIWQNTGASLSTTSIAYETYPELTLRWLAPL
jgi:hypothetical protein